MNPITLAALSLICASPAPPDAGAVSPLARPVLKLGIGQPQGEAPALKAKAQIEPYLSRVLGQPVQVVILPKYELLSSALTNSDVDVAWITPIAYVTAHAVNPEVKALAKARRNGASFYRTAFIVRRDSPAQSLTDLRGKRVAWVDRGSGSGYLYPRALLARAGQDPDKFFATETIAGSHPGVCRAVRDGTADVGATLCDQPVPGKEFQADGCVDAPPISDFRVIAASEPIPNDVVAARPGLDAKTSSAIASALMMMAGSGEGKTVLTDAFRVEGWAAPAERDFEPVQGVLKTASSPFVPIIETTDVAAISDAGTQPGAPATGAGQPAKDAGR